MKFQGKKFQYSFAYALRLILLLILLVDHLQRSVPSSPGPNWLNSPGSSSGLIAKRTIRVDIPVDNYPNV